MLFLTTSLISSPFEIPIVSLTWTIGVGVGVVIIHVVIANKVGCLSFAMDIAPMNKHFHRNHMIGLVLPGIGPLSWSPPYSTSVFSMPKSRVDKALKTSIWITPDTFLVVVVYHISSDDD